MQKKNRAQRAGLSGANEFEKSDAASSDKDKANGPRSEKRSFTAYFWGSLMTSPNDQEADNKNDDVGNNRQFGVHAAPNLS